MSEAINWKAPAPAAESEAERQEMSSIAATKRQSKHVLVLRTCDKDMKSHGGFVWPAKGVVKCPDWDPKPECGNGLHGLLWGEGDGSLLDWAADAKWLVVEVPASSIVEIGGKVKFPHGTVVHCGDQASATAYLAAHGGEGRAITGGTATTGDYGTAIAGDMGTAIAGDMGTATVGHGGTAIAGDGGTATTGDYGTAIAGNYGTAIAGDGGTAVAGYNGRATAGANGTATAGDGGTIQIWWWDESANRRRLAVGYVGEDGIKPGTAYRVDDNGKLTEASK